MQEQADSEICKEHKKRRLTTAIFQSVYKNGHHFTHLSISETVHVSSLLSQVMGIYQCKPVHTSPDVWAGNGAKERNNHFQKEKKGCRVRVSCYSLVTVHYSLICF